MLWQAVALSLDLEPADLDIEWRPADYSDPFEDCPAEFKTNLKIAINHLKNGALPHTMLAFTNLPMSEVRLIDFAEWARALPSKWDLPPQFPGRPTFSAIGTIGRETACKAWLIELMQDNSKPEKSRDEYKKEALPKFKIGERAFQRAWSGAIQETGNANWSKPGPKPKS